MSEQQEFYAYIDKQIDGIPDLLPKYREMTKKWYFRAADTASEAVDLPTLFSMDKMLTVGAQSKVVGKDDDNVSTSVTCPLSGELNVTSAYQSIYTVPIGSVPVLLKADDGSVVKSQVLNPQGETKFKDLEPGKKYTVEINHEPSEDELDALFAHYDALSADLVKWLTKKWEGFKPRWEVEFRRSFSDDIVAILGQFAEGLWDGLVDFWKGIGDIYDLLKDPESALQDMKEGAADIIASIKEAAESAPEKLEKLMLFASDEAAMFLFINAIMAYISMAPMMPFFEELAKLGGSVIVGVLIGLLGGVIVSFIATPAMGVAYATFKIAKNVSKAAWTALEPFLNIFSELLEYAKKLITNAGLQYKRLALNKGGTQEYRNGTVMVKADNQTNSVLEGRESKLVDDSEASKTETDKPTQKEDNTVCDEDPISMVTGEELLSIVDGELIGLLPFEWKRLYRTSAVEHNNGLGFGWTHPLAHSLRVDGDDIIWKDSESKLTRYPRPTRQLPAVTNTMAGSAAFLNQDDNIVILSDDKHYIFELDGDVGKLLTIKDKYDHQLHIKYDNNQRPVEVSTDTNVKYVLTYNDQSLIKNVDLYARQANSQEWQLAQTQVRYAYNERQQLIAASNANGEVEKYTYDELHVIQSRELAGGAIFYWDWEGSGKEVRAIRQYSNLDNVDTTYEWDDAANTVTLTSSNGTQQVYQHDENARLVREVDASGGEYLKEYDDKGRLTAEIDALGNKTEYRFNDRGEMIAKTEPNGVITEFRYHKNLLTDVIQDSATWRYRYDDFGNIAEQVNPLGHTTRYRYNDHGLIDKITYADGSAHQLHWNLNGQLIEEVTPQGEKIRYRYDVMGRLRYRQDSLGVTELHYDPVGRLIKHVLPGGYVRTYQYNAYSKVTQQTDEQGRKTQFEYAWPNHQVTRRINPDGTSLQYAYHNRFNFLSEIINERGERYEIEYAPTGHVSREVTFDGREFRYEYDAHTQLIAKTEVGSQGTELVTQYQYDALGNVIAKILPDESEVHYEYDARGQLTQVDDGHWPLVYRYNVLGQLQEEHQGWASQGYTYDAMGQLTSMTLPDGQVVDYQFSKGRVQHVSLNGERLTTHQYKANGLETDRQHGSLKSQYLYDEMGRLLEHTSRQQAQLKLRRRYEYSQAGNLTSIDDAQRGQTQYDYDPLDRLTTVRGVVDESFLHDPAGNLLLDRKANVEGNQLRFQGDKHYTYDEFGNLARESRGRAGKLVTDYEYDVQHRLIKVTKPDGSVATYQYDAFGRRIEKSVTDKIGQTFTTEFLWQGNKLLAESSDSHYQTYLYEYGSFRPLAMITGEGPDNAQAYFYHVDQIGTPLEITDAEGTIAWAVDYHAYGNVARERVKVVNSPLRFQGQYHDEETGLHYNRHRYYSPDTGRFITVDPIGLAGGLNNYQYVKNPTGWVDPLGLCQGPAAYSNSLKERSAQRAKFLKDNSSKNKLKQLAATSRAGINGKYETPDFENLGGPNPLSDRNKPDSVIKLGDGELIKIPDVNEYVNEYLTKSYAASTDAGLHPVTADWIKQHLTAHNGEWPLKNNGLPGTHAEVRAMNDINHYLTDMGIDHNSFDYSQVDVATHKLSPDRHGGQGSPFSACLHCSGIIPRQVNVITGRTN
ncbi:RHS repeat-associated core domain-containing protein [Vibrio palustris]|uniref:Putative deoxyribonuclease RhsC n=1 Tax=Vibrio palustris TaxID=1918946 RepID=A0A1R4B5U7_9VIBR|nr:RHS repeat-associated core domain-containing protein [Vibrio palustris]SJL84295.1 Putative deoxyribonuclease RhsC [Vibrio palustris]